MQRAHPVTSTAFRPETGSFTVVLCIFLLAACGPTRLGTYYDVLPQLSGSHSVQIVEATRCAKLLPNPHRWHVAERRLVWDLNSGSVKDAGLLSNRSWAELRNRDPRNASVKVESYRGSEWALALETGHGEWHPIEPPRGRFRGHHRVWTTADTPSGMVLFVGGQTSVDSRAIEFWRFDVGSGAWLAIASPLLLGHAEQPVGASACSAERVFVAIRDRTSTCIHTLEGNFRTGRWTVVGEGNLSIVAPPGFLLDMSVRRSGQVFRLRRLRLGVEEYASIPSFAADYVRVRVLPAEGRFILEYHREATSFPFALALAGWTRVLSVLPQDMQGVATSTGGNRDLIWCASTSRTGR